MMKRRYYRIVKWTALPCSVLLAAFCVMAAIDGRGIQAPGLGLASVAALLTWLRPEGPWSRHGPNESMIQQVRKERRERPN